MNYFELLPEEIFTIICQHLKSDIKKLINIDSTYLKKIIDTILNNIRTGNVDPDVWFITRKITKNYLMGPGVSFYIEPKIESLSQMPNEIDCYIEIKYSFGFYVILKIECYYFAVFSSSLTFQITEKESDWSRFYSRLDELGKESFLKCQSY